MKNSEIQQQLPATLFTLVLLILGAWYFFAESVDTYPAYIHAWTQTDRLALAMNFQENGFDFFHPATYSLLTKDGITQVDFPIHDYLVALISSKFNMEIVPVFRFYNLLYSILGIFFFFRLCLLSIKSPLRSIFATFFLFTIPFFVYYQNGLLPSAPSFANFLIATYFLLKARIRESNKHYIIGTLFLTLAALARAPFLVFLLALLLQQVWQQWKQKKFNWVKIILPLSGIILFIAYYFYNLILANTYGSMFLSEFLYFKSFNQFIEVIRTAIDRWSNEILSPYHAIVLAVILIFSTLQYKNKGIPNKITSSLLHYFLISSIGVLFFFFAFGQQFADHDYYYIDTFLPLLSLLLILLFGQLEIPKRWYTTAGTLGCVFLFYFFSYAKSTQLKRYSPPYNDRIEYAYSTYLESKNDLEGWGVKKEDTLYVLEANSTNMPFTVWKNRGFTSLNSAEEVVKKELQQNFTYAVLVDSFFVMGAFNDYPNLITQLKRVNGNGKLSLYKKNTTNNTSAFFENLIYYGYSDFDAQSNIGDSVTAWTAKEVVTDSLGKSLKIQSENLYTLTIKNKLSKIVPNKPIKIHLLGDYLQADSSKINIVCSINNYYRSHYTISHFKKMNEWMHHQFNFKIPSTYFKKDDELILYFWNPKKGELFVDNLKILIYQ